MEGDDDLFSPSGIENTLSEFRRTAQQLDGLLTDIEQETSRVGDTSMLDVDSDMSDDERGEDELRSQLNAISLPNTPMSAIHPDSIEEITPMQSAAVSPLNSSPESIGDDVPPPSFSPMRTRQPNFSPLRPMHPTPMDDDDADDDGVHDDNVPQPPISARSLGAGKLFFGPPSPASESDPVPTVKKPLKARVDLGAPTTVTGEEEAPGGEIGRAHV